MNIKYIVFLLSISCLLFIPDRANSADFITDSYDIENDTGYHQLEWEATPDVATEVQQATLSDFENAKTLYKGMDRASYISGLENGTYFFRVREEGGEWSPTLTLTVQHQSLQLAFTLFGLGALVFLLTVWVVVKGTRQANMA